MLYKVTRCIIVRVGVFTYSGFFWMPIKPAWIQDNPSLFIKEVTNIHQNWVSIKAFISERVIVARHIKCNFLKGGMYMKSTL